ncbi:MAG: alpha/beta hydrolase [Betaproteobacteria bacterium]
MTHAHINGIDIHYELTDFTDPWRESLTIFLHHGFGRNLNFWREWVPLLARHYRVVRMDARGCGRSSVPPVGSPYSLDLLVSDALGLINHLGLKRVHWAAEASGGHVGLALALEHPDKLASITLCNTPFQLPQSANDLFSEEEVNTHGLGFWARKTLANRIDLDKVSLQWQEWSIQEHQKTPAHIAIAQHRMIAAGNLLSCLHRIQTPTLVMAGVNSQIAPKSQMQKMQQALPNSKLVLFDGYTQGIAFSAPERCVQHMRDFLLSLEGSL